MTQYAAEKLTSARETSIDATMRDVHVAGSTFACHSVNLSIPCHPHDWNDQVVSDRRCTFLPQSYRDDDRLTLKFITRVPRTTVSWLTTITVDRKILCLVSGCQNVTYDIYS